NLGNGSNLVQSTPTKIILPNEASAVAVTGSNYATFVIASDGTIYSTGYNDNGHLGTGVVSTKFYPVQLPKLAGVRQVVYGQLPPNGSYFGGYAIASDGVYFWGSIDVQHKASLPALNTTMPGAKRIFLSEGDGNGSYFSIFYTTDDGRLFASGGNG